MPSLALLVAGADAPPADGSYLAILDAMRGDVYAATIEARDGSVITVGDEQLVPRRSVTGLASRLNARVVGGGEPPDALPHARGLARLDESLVRDVSLTAWEPAYGRLAEAQVKWEAEHGRSLAAG
jgi:tRNA threonylcarbamoyladenosine biosynthesis protein TsaB